MSQKPPGVYATRCRIIPNIDGYFQISLLNTTASPMSLAATECLGSLAKIDRTADQAQHSEELEKRNLEQLIQFGENLSSHQGRQISNLISQFPKIFASNPKKPARLKHMQRCIITEDTHPVIRKPYLIPYAWHQETDKQISEMLQNNIIRPSSSLWNAPVILVKKKDGSIRFVCDFRGLSEVTKKETYPLPHIRDVLDKMHGTKYWSTLDAASAYWSMPLHETDKEKTAFSMPHGKFEFNVTPFGLCNAGASYQRLMDIPLSGLSSTQVLEYINDIVIFTKSFPEHLSDVTEIFQSLQASKISLKLSKCRFASSKVDFLGYELSRNGIQPQTRLTNAIRTYQRPLSKKELKGFLGLAGFYRAFVPNFSLISSPLNKLTSDSSQYVWTDNCEHAFCHLKDLLTSKPILQFPDLNMPIYSRS